MDLNNVGEMLSKAIVECNESLEAAELTHRFTTDISQGDEIYDVYMAKKKNGKPKSDYPSKCLTQTN